MRGARILLALILSLGLVPRAEALRCGGDLVVEGDLAYEVRRACGEPDWVRSYHRTHRSGDEVWHYNFGPTDLIRVMHFRDGRLRRVQTAGRGFVPPRQPGRCRPTEVTTGMSALELLQRCGEPVQREGGWTRYLRDLPTLPGHRPRHGFHEVFVEDWYYDFSDNYLLRRVRLIDGVVAEVATAD